MHTTEAAKYILSNAHVIMMTIMMMIVTMIVIIMGERDVNTASIGVTVLYSTLLINVGTQFSKAQRKNIYDKNKNMDKKLKIRLGIMSRDYFQCD